MSEYVANYWKTDQISPEVLREMFQSHLERIISVAIHCSNYAKYNEETKRISVDTKVLQKMLSVPPAQAQQIDWVALAGGGAVGVRDRIGSNDIYLIKSVSDLIFKGTGVSLERKGKDVELTFTDTGTYTESTTVPSSPSDGDRWHETDSGKLFTYSSSQQAWIEF